MFLNFMKLKIFGMLFYVFLFPAGAFAQSSSENNIKKNITAKSAKTPQKTPSVKFIKGPIHRPVIIETGDINPHRPPSGLCYWDIGSGSWKHVETDQ